MNIEDLEKKIEKNANKINNNADRINSNLEKIEKNSYALDILKDYKEDSKRLFIILIIVICAWIGTIGYLIYVLNDIDIVEETTQEVTQENENGSNNFIGNDGDITNGKAEG